jgi:hypothetical protein
VSAAAAVGGMVNLIAMVIKISKNTAGIRWMVRWYCLQVVFSAMVASLIVLIDLKCFRKDFM